MESLNSIIEQINNDDRCLFLAYMGNNLEYISINAFVNKLHDEDGYESFSGIVVNLRNDPNYGHTFADDSFRFPSFANIKVIHLSDNASDGTKKEKLVRLCNLVKKVIRNKRKSPLFVISSSANFHAVAKMICETDRCVVHVFTIGGAYYAPGLKWALDGAKDFFLRVMERVLVRTIVFRPFSYGIGMKRNLDIEHFFKKATENEHLNLIHTDKNEKYIIYISQNSVYEQYIDIVRETLENEKKKGYKIYIKPHSHERTPYYPKSDDYCVLPLSYAIESIVAGASRKPDKIISVASTALFTCSAWFDVPCYSIANLISTAKLSKEELSCFKEFYKLVRGDEYPLLQFYGGKQ